MKLKLLPLAIGVASLPFATQAAPTVYGKVNVTVQNVSLDDGSEDEIQVKSNASRLGVKGKTEISEGLHAIYKAEYQTDVTEEEDVFSQRDIWGGLQGGFGTLRIGTMDTPLKKAQGKFDQFNDYLDMKKVFEAEDRAPNQINYATPSFGGVTITAALTAGEGRDDSFDDDGNLVEEGEDNGLDGFSGSVVYSAGPIFASAAFSSDVEKDNEEATRLTFVYNAGAFQVGALWQEFEEGDDEATDGFGISGAFKFGNSKVKAQLNTGDDEKEGAEQLNLGYDYKLAKSTKVFAFISAYENDSDNSAEDVFGVGFETKF